MKKLKFVYTLLIVSVGIQAISYYGIDRFLGNRNGTNPISATPISSSGKEAMDISVPLPANAKNIVVSDDLSYVAYISDGNLKILESKTYDEIKTSENHFYNRDTKKFDTKSTGNVTCAKWVPNKNVLMYTLSSTGNSNGKVQLFSYNADSGTEFQGVELKNSIPKGSTGVDVIISPLNMITYVKVKTGSSNAKIFRTDINNEAFEPFSADLDTIAKIGHYSDTLIFNGDNNKLYQKSGTKVPTKLKYDKKGVILGIAGMDKEGKDMVYIGEANSDGKITNVLNGMVDTDISKWVQTPLKSPVSPENIIISFSGNILEVKEEKKTNYIVNLGKNKETKFPGKFMSIIGDKVIYLEDNKVKSKSY